MFGALRAWFSVLASVLIVGNMPGSIVAQTTETTRGQLIATITDSTGAAVGDALVILTRGAEHSAR